MNIQVSQVYQLNIQVSDVYQLPLTMVGEREACLGAALAIFDRLVVLLIILMKFFDLDDNLNFENKFDFDKKN